MPKDQTPEPDEPRPDDDPVERGSGKRRPPGPGDVPISNLPPPGDEDETAAVVADGTDVEDGPGEGSEGDAAAPDPDAAAEEAGPAEEDPAGDAGDAGKDDGDDGSEAGADGDADDPEPTAETGEPPSDRPAGRTRSRRTLVVALVALAGLVFGAVQHQRAEDLETQRDDRRAVERVADAFGSAYLSYDFNDPGRSARAVQRLSTAAFAEAYAAQSAPGIQELFSSRQTTTRAETQEVFVGAVRRASARALVVVDVTATSPTDGEQELDGVSFVLDLARASGGWRVTKVVRAPQPVLQQPPATTTTAPAPPP